jgi:DNA-binding NtrC family response regulator
VRDTINPSTGSGQAQGNVRQLENAVRRAVLLGDGVTIRPVDLGLALPPEDVTAAQPAATPYRVQKRLLIERFERQYLTELMTRYHGNLSHAASASGKDRRDLRRLLESHKRDRAAFQTKD